MIKKVSMKSGLEGRNNSESFLSHANDYGMSQ